MGKITFKDVEDKYGLLTYRLASVYPKCVSELYGCITLDSDYETMLNIVRNSIKEKYKVDYKSIHDMTVSLNSLYDDAAENETTLAFYIAYYRTFGVTRHTKEHLYDLQGNPDYLRWFLEYISIDTMGRLNVNEMLKDM
jgi:hypothetical protein